ncbi:MAG: rod shape-determining protein MreC [Candidatus Doudnabacteria bacterium]|nr:rod shape-determining protein MreC [Candidatus Doudnabacteria bacterium]
MRFIYTKTFLRIFLIFVLLAFLVVLDAKGYIGKIKDGFFNSYGFLTRKLTDGTNGFKNSFSTLFTIRKLVRENSQLSQEVDQLAFENARLKSAQDENAALRRALNFRQQGSFSLLAVEVINSDPTGFTQTIVIDKGSDLNIHLNQPIVAQPGLLVGKVTKVYPGSAEVTLITDPAIVINGEVVESGAKGLIKGEHGLGLSLDLVTQNELIKTGDQVITSGLSNDFPRGLLIGNISAIRSSTTDLFQKAFVSPAAELRNSRFLFAIQ